MISCYAPREGMLRRSDRPEPGSVWIDLLNPSAEEICLAQQIVAIDLPSRTEMAEIEESARLYEENGAIYLTAIVVTGASGRAPPVGADVTFILTARNLVTIRYADPLAFRNFEARCARQPEACGSPEQVFLSLVEAIVGRVADLLEASDAKLDALSAGIFLDDEAAEDDRPRSPPPRPDLRRVLSQIGRVGALAAKLRQSLLGLGRMLAFIRQSSIGIRLPEDTRGRIAEMESDVRSLADHDAQQSANVAFLLEATLGLIDIEQSKIIKTFTIASVALMPPTLVASIYGMNFEHMPELKWEYGYPLSLSVMLASALLPVWYFRRRGWL